MKITKVKHHYQIRFRVNEPNGPNGKRQRKFFDTREAVAPRGKMSRKLLATEYKLWSGGALPHGADGHELSEAQHVFVEKDASSLAAALLLPAAALSALHRILLPLALRQQSGSTPPSTSWLDWLQPISNDVLTVILVVLVMSRSGTICAAGLKPPRKAPALTSN